MPVGGKSISEGDPIMLVRRRPLQILSIIVILTLLFSENALPIVQAKENIENHISTYPGLPDPENEVVSSVIWKGSSDTIQAPTPTSVPTEILPLDAQASEAASSTWYVSTTGNDSNACSDPSFPCATINAAIDRAISGDTIKVALGIYIGTGYEVVEISRSIMLSGGWDTTFTVQQGFSTIDGQNLRKGVLIEVTNVSLTRFIIQNCVGSGLYIDNSGGATISKSIIANNESDSSFGGGVVNEGSLTINNSSIHHNVTEYVGGGIYNYGALTINNSTISYNSADWGGGISAGGTTALNNVTVSHNSADQGGGIYATGLNVTLKNTIVANNTAWLGPDCTNTITSNGYNIIKRTDACAITPVTGDKFNVDPRLSEFNPALGLYSLRPTSPAIDAGNPVTPGSQPDACLPVDQREAARPVDGPDADLDARCDIGSYEYTVPGSVSELLYFDGSPQVVTPTLQLSYPMRIVALDSQGTPVPNAQVTFRAPEMGPSGVFTASNTHEATVFTDSDGIAMVLLFTANNLIGTYNIVASTPGVTNTVTFVITNGYWLVAMGGSDSNDCVTIDSPCATIQGVLKKSYFSNGHTIRVGIGSFATTEYIVISQSITISGGWDPTFMSQIGASTIEDVISTSIGTQVVLENLTIRNNLVTPGISNNGDLTINRSSIIKNRQGIYNTGTLTIINSTISENGSIQNPTNFGGGIENYNPQAIARVDIVNSTIANNIASHGGGISNSGSAAGVVTLKNSIIAGNTAVWGGGPDCEGGHTIDSGDIVSLGYNIVGTIGSYNGVMYFCTVNWQSTDVVGADDHPVDAGLDLLTSPGDGVWIHPIMPDSPAVDAIPSNNCPLIDQLGVARPKGISCDIGAYEFPTIFRDVSSRFWAWQYVERLYKAGITGGCGTNPLAYCPESTVTRAQMAVFLERGMHGSSYAPPALGGSTGFVDVESTHWAGAWIKQLAAEGITGGCGSGSYCPESPVTRAQMAVFLLKAKYGSAYIPPALGGSTGFADVSTTHWAAAWIKQLAAEGITGGCGTGTYCPDAAVTRAQMAVFLVRTFNLP
jgi:predicted outer membrane repeat protein